MMETRKFCKRLGRNEKDMGIIVPVWRDHGGHFLKVLHAVLPLPVPKSIYGLLIMLFKFV